MNTASLMGRLTKDPDVRVINNEKHTQVARFTLAVDRPGRDKGADFISCTAFGQRAEFAEKYLSKGTKIAITGRIQTGKYQDRDNRTVYTTDVVAEQIEFCEKKADAPQAKTGAFEPIPEDMDAELPFV